MLQDLDNLDEAEGVRGLVLVRRRPDPHAGFDRRRIGEEEGARQPAEEDVAAADVEGDEQVLGGIERVIHRSDSHGGVRWGGQRGVWWGGGAPGAGEVSPRGRGRAARGGW